MCLILLRNPNRIKVALLALHVHFICVGLNCQHKTEKTPGGIWVKGKGGLD